MQYRQIGKTGLWSSTLAMGTMSFGGAADKETSKRIFEACLDAGINHFDCANVYNQGKSEELLGEFAAEHRNRLVLATKVYFPTSGDINARGGSRYHIVRAVEDSLRRLNTDRIDILYLHRHDPNTAIGESLRAIEDLVRQGKVLYPALSNFSAWQTMEALAEGERHGFARIACIQPMYNLVKRQAEVEILPMAKAMGLGVFPYSPLGGGLLTGKYSAAKQPAEGRLVENQIYGVRYKKASYHQTTQDFTQLAAELNVHPVSLAIAWVCKNEAITAPLLGARNLEQLAPALQSVDIDMTDELYARLTALSEEPPPATDRNEEAAGLHYGGALKK